MDGAMNMNRRPQRERSPEGRLVFFVSFGVWFFGLLVALWLAGTGFASPARGAETRKQGGILRLARTTDPKTLDPLLMGTMQDYLLMPLMHLPLLDLVGGTNLVPCGAEAWSASPDQRVFTVHLRPGVKFSNGRAVVAADYVFTLERFLDPGTASGGAYYLSDIRGAKAFTSGKTNHLAGVIALSPRTFRVELEHPDATFPYNFWIMAIPGEEFVGHESRYAICPVGSGPYMVQEWARGAYLKLKRNPHYQGPEPQHLDGVEILIGGDETTHLMMFERSELDLANITGSGIPRASFQRLTRDPRWRGLVERVPLFFTDFVNLNTEIPPLTNVLVRRAINHAIDRDRRMGVALGFYSHAEGVIPPIMPGYNPELRGYRYDPDKARQLLRESGLPLPWRTQLWHEHSDEKRTLAQGIQWDLQQIGIEVELKPVAITELADAISTRGKVPMILHFIAPVLPDPKDILGSLFNGRAATNNSGQNWAFYNNPEVTRLLDDAAIATEAVCRFRLYQRAEEIIVRDAPWVFLGHPNCFALRQPWLKGRLLEPQWWYRFDRVWIE